MGDSLEMRTAYFFFRRMGSQHTCDDSCGILRHSGQGTIIKTGCLASSRTSIVVKIRTGMYQVEKCSLVLDAEVYAAAPTIVDLTI